MTGTCIRHRNHSHIWNARDMQDSLPLLVLSDGLLVVQYILPSYDQPIRFRINDCMFSVSRRSADAFGQRQ